MIHSGLQDPNFNYEKHKTRSINIQAPSFMHGVLIANCESRIANCNDAANTDSDDSNADTIEITNTLDTPETIFLIDTIDTKDTTRATSTQNNTDTDSQQQHQNDEPPLIQENDLIQREYAAKIAPTIHQFWMMQKQPQSLEGNHYDIKLQDNILTLTRKSGEKIAMLSTDNSSPPQGFALTESDVETFKELQRVLDERIKRQIPNKNQGLEY